MPCQALATRRLAESTRIFMSAGEYVAAEKLESLFRTCRLIDSIWVYGNSYETCLVAVVKPEKAALQEWAESEGIEGDMTTICGHPKVGTASQTVKGQRSAFSAADSISFRHKHTPACRRVCQSI